MRLTIRAKFAEGFRIQWIVNIENLDSLIARGQVEQIVLHGDSVGVIIARVRVAGYKLRVCWIRNVDNLYAVILPKQIHVAAGLCDRVSRTTDGKSPNELRG